MTIYAHQMMILNWDKHNNNGMNLNTSFLMRIWGRRRFSLGNGRLRALKAQSTHFKWSSIAADNSGRAACFGFWAFRGGTKNFLISRIFGISLSFPLLFSIIASLIWYSTILILPHLYVMRTCYAIKWSNKFNCIHLSVKSCLFLVSPSWRLDLSPAIHLRVWFWYSWQPL